jgi:hypothetical protein
METKTLNSGRELGLGMAPFSVGNKLRKVVALELKSVDFSASDLNLSADVLKDTKALNCLKNLLCQAMASDALEAAFFECAARCTLDGIKITRDTFEPENMRGDFLPVAWEVIRFNLAPFFGNLDLSFLGSAKQTPESPR